MADPKKVVRKTIELLAPHTHAGRDYQIGAILTLDSDQADWLIGNKWAREAPKDTKPENV